MKEYIGFISRRYLTGGEGFSFFSLAVFLSVFGVGLGVAALVIVMAVMTGFTSEMKTRILAVNSHGVILRYSGGFEPTTQLMETIEGADGVKAAAPFVYSQAMLTSTGGARGAIIRGFRPEDIDRIGSLPRNIKSSIDDVTDGRLFEKRRSAEEEGVELWSLVLGSALAEQLDVVVGDEINLVSPVGRKTEQGPAPKIQRFIVSGIFSSGFYEYDNSLAYMRMDVAQDFFDMSDFVTGVEIAVSDLDRADKICDELEEKLGYPFWARDWKELNRNLFSALETEKYVMFLLICVIIAVASLNIVSSMIMLVVEKRGEIGILRAMGATSSAVGLIFLRLGLIVGSIGAVVGLVIGSIICYAADQFNLVSLPPDVYFISSFPIRPDLTGMVIVAASAIAITSLFTIIPARLAARTLPADALRYD